MLAGQLVQDGIERFAVAVAESRSPLLLTKELEVQFNKKLVLIDVKCVCIICFLKYKISRIILANPQQ